MSLVVISKFDAIAAPLDVSHGKYFLRNCSAARLLIGAAGEARRLSDESACGKTDCERAV